MNKERLKKIFNNYIDNIDLINNDEHEEYQKWAVAKKFREYMDIALSKDGAEFVEELSKVKKISWFIVDNSMVQPFAGIVKYAQKEPNVVKQMFEDLYKDDGGDLTIRQEKIVKFYQVCDELLNKYYPNSHRFKQNSHSVSSFLFLYDPDNHYLYKAMQSKDFADCIEYYDDWGSGDNIDLKRYYTMCDWVIEQIKNSKELLEASNNKVRSILKDEMHGDTNNHILLFDIIYCCNVYGLYHNIDFDKPRLSEKREYLNKVEKAKVLFKKLNAMEEQIELLNNAKNIFNDINFIDLKLTHKTYGKGIIKAINGLNANILFDNGIEKILFLPTILVKDIVKLEDNNIKSTLQDVLLTLENYRNIESDYQRALNNFEPYKQYID